MRADLHVHTVYSDGNYSPEKVVSIAKANGVDMLAVTDHDTAEGVTPFFECAEKAGITPVAGVEISAYLGDVKLHTLAYNFNRQDGGFRQFLKMLKENSVKRGEDILFKLKKCGVNITLEEALAERFSSSTPLHSIHISRAGAKKGFAQNGWDFYNKYIAYGKPAFSNILRPSPEETVEAITSAGGFASLAHPARVWLEAGELVKLIKRLIPCGLQGIEGAYSTHTVEQTAYFNGLAKELGLLITGGSDTHRVDGIHDIGVPEFHPCAELVKRLTK